MDKKQFYKDRHKKIMTSFSIISSTLANLTLADLKEKRLTDIEIDILKSQSNELVRQFHQLEAGRNIFIDNDKDQKIKLKT